MIETTFFRVREAGRVLAEVIGDRAIADGLDFQPVPRRPDTGADQRDRFRRDGFFRQADAEES